MVIVHVPGNETPVEFPGTVTVSIEDGCLVVYKTSEADEAMGGFAKHHWAAFELVNDYG